MQQQGLKLYSYRLRSLACTRLSRARGCGRIAGAALVHLLEHVLARVGVDDLDGVLAAALRRALLARRWRLHERGLHLRRSHLRGRYLLLRHRHLLLLLLLLLVRWRLSSGRRRRHHVLRVLLLLLLVQGAPHHRHLPIVEHCLCNMEKNLPVLIHRFYNKLCIFILRPHYQCGILRGNQLSASII
jgi:hypothetical protein